MSDYIETSVAYGLSDGEFDHLSESDKKKLVALMARIAEQSYRRGFQQGFVVDEDERSMSAQELRFNWPLSKSPEVLSLQVISSVERLFIECPVLRHIGFRGQST